MSGSVMMAVFNFLGRQSGSDLLPLSVITALPMMSLCTVSMCACVLFVECFINFSRTISAPGVML